MDNPYALDVMQEVYDECGDNTVLEATDLYVRFLPQDSLQAQQLRDLNLELFDYPLDIKLGEGQEYVDPTIPEGSLGWLYTTVKPDFQFPSDITHEILERCYIPKEGETIQTDGPRTRGGGGFVDVERAAFEKI